MQRDCAKILRYALIDEGLHGYATRALNMQEDPWVCALSMVAFPALQGGSFLVERGHEKP